MQLEVPVITLGMHNQGGKLGVTMLLMLHLDSQPGLRTTECKQFSALGTIVSLLGWYLKDSFYVERNFIQ